MNNESVFGVFYFHTDGYTYSYDTLCVIFRTKKEAEEHIENLQIGQSFLEFEENRDNFFVDELKFGEPIVQ
jgi:hypothetical protein